MKTLRYARIIFIPYIITSPENIIYILHNYCVWIIVEKCILEFCFKKSHCRSFLTNAKPLYILVFTLFPKHRQKGNILLL